MGVVILVFTSCGGPREAVRELPPIPPECILLPPPSCAADTVNVALLHPVDPRNAPNATNPGEELVFSQLYTPLTTVDCTGALRPAIAASWESEANHTKWTFHLDQTTRFWDGTRVTAPVFTLSEHLHASTAPAMFDSLVDSIMARSNYELEIYLNESRSEVPRGLMSQFFAARPAETWPVGTGNLRISTAASGGSPTRTITQTVRSEPEVVVVFNQYADTDPRDVLAKSVDLLVTSDPSAIEYAASQPRLVTRPLPWDRTYLLVSRSRFDALLSGETVGEVVAEQLRTLARDAVRLDARGHDRAGWWADVDDCRAVVSAGAADLPRPLEPSRHGLVIYERTDPVARRLAERVVALAAGSGATESGLHHAIPRLGELALATQAVEPPEMSERLRTGQDFLYVVALPLRPPDPCTAGARFLERVPWLAHLGDDFLGATVGLVDTRRHVIADSSRVGVVVDWFGGIRIITESTGKEHAEVRGEDHAP